MLDGTEPIADGEELYRRIPISNNWYDPATDSRPSPKAFRPHRADETGLSVFRAKYNTPDQVAENERGSRYYIAVLRAGDLRANGLEVVPKAVPPDCPGHAEILSLTYENRRTAEAEGQQLLLAERLCVRIEGPFPEAKGNA